MIFFLVLGKAFAILSDKDKRDNYEQYGADGPQIQQRGGGGFHHHGGFYDDDGINPEEIFNMFFGGGMPQGMSFFCLFIRPLDFKAIRCLKPNGHSIFFYF